MRISIGLYGLVAACLSVGTALACGPGKLGTSRVMEIDTSKYREIQGHEKSFGLRPKEVVLTFDDGPIAGKTPRVLQALKDECVKATFFYVGRMAKVYPRLVRRVVADGHTLAHHTHSHNRLPKYSTANASYHIDRGVQVLQKIAYSDDSAVARIPFFRYPYLARNKSTDRILERKGMIAFGANIDSRDWQPSSSAQVHDRIMRLLRKKGKGIILMHDIQNRTAKMLPRLLRTLRYEGYKVVHIVPKGGSQPNIEQERDPIVVAGLTRSEPQGVPALPGLSKRQPDHSDREIARIADEAERDVQKMIVVSGGSDAKRPAKLTIVDAPKPTTVRVPTQVAARQEQQLASKKTTSKSRRVARLQADIDSVTRKRKRRKSLTVVAGNDESRKARIVRKNKRLRRAKPKRVAKNVVLRGNWKLRRSQWIIN